MVHEGHLDVVMRAARSRVTARDRRCVNTTSSGPVYTESQSIDVKTEMRIKNTKQIKHNK